MYHNHVSETVSNLKSIIISFAVFLYVNFFGLILQDLAEIYYSVLINLNPQLNLPAPDFYRSIFHGSLLELLSIPSDLLQLLLNLWNLSNATMSQSWSRDINILISLLSFLNFILSFFLKNRYASIALSISLCMANTTVILPLLKYLMSLFTDLINISVSNFTY